MKRVNRIIGNMSYLKYTAEIKLAETDRRFCRHGQEHCLDVARIMMLLNDEEGYELNKEHIYAAALLHDIGRAAEYQSGISHEQAGPPIAGTILKECGFEPGEIEMITAAIGSHRDAGKKEEHTLDGLLYRADKLSRACFSCEAEADCRWDTDKKNMRIQY